MKTPHAALAGLALALSATLAFAALTKSDAPASTSFYAKTPTGTLVVGTTSALQVGEQNGTVVVTVPLAGMDTGNAQINKHLRERDLQTDLYPAAELRVSRGVLRFPNIRANLSTSATGTLTLHGTTRPVTFLYDSRREGDTYRVRGTVRINVRDYGVQSISLLGVDAAPEVEIVSNFQAKDLL